ncbi:hypothetical protein TTRE_0000085301 [Trichuris trichiura]|uniref:DUF7107 domain-containing protein n=1 Tax=Trichuris trichiura TaxID=36087 RepID=A0A077YXV6_TRITR|nr:hypothetical protein TTRE_0000085301 [Trichuris trichiura]
MLNMSTLQVGIMVDIRVDSTRVILDTTRANKNALCRARCAEMLKQSYMQEELKSDYATSAINDVSFSGNKRCKEHSDCNGQQVCFDGACKTAYPTKERCSKDLLTDAVFIGGKKKKIVDMKQVESSFGAKGKDSLRMGFGQHRESHGNEKVVSSHSVGHAIRGNSMLVQQSSNNGSGKFSATQKKYNLSSSANSQLTSKEVHKREISVDGSKATFGNLSSSSHFEAGTYNTHRDGSISQTFYTVEMSTKLSRLNEAQMLVRMLQSSLEGLMLSNVTLTTGGLACHESSCICDGFTCLQKISRLLAEQHSTLGLLPPARQSSNKPSGDGQLDRLSLNLHMDTASSKG